MSSSKRGRKRNDLLPPNRARDVQRAFRARRAAHLQALEQRVTELEEENALLRQALNLPPAARPPLGRGPTGNDKPRMTGQGAYHSFEHLLEVTGQDYHAGSSSPESDAASTRPTSASPGVGSAGPENPPPPLEGPNWENALLMSDKNAEMDYPPGSSSSSSSFPSQPPMSAPLPTRPSSFPPFQPPVSPSPIQSTSSAPSSSAFAFATPTPAQDISRDKPSGSFSSLFSQPSTADKPGERPHRSSLYTPSLQNYLHQPDRSDEGHSRPQSYNPYSASSPYETNLRHDNALSHHQHQNQHQPPQQQPLGVPRHNILHSSSLSGAVAFPQALRRAGEPYHFSAAASSQANPGARAPHGVGVPSPPHHPGATIPPSRGDNPYP